MRERAGRPYPDSWRRTNRSPTCSYAHTTWRYVRHQYVAILSSQSPVKSLIIERYPTRLAAPKAHALSPRSLELCRQFDLDVNEIRNIGTNRDDAYWVNFVTSLTGQYVGSLPYERMDAEVLEQTPTVVNAHFL